MDSKDKKIFDTNISNKKVGKIIKKYAEITFKTVFVLSIISYIVLAIYSLFIFDQTDGFSLIFLIVVGVFIFISLALSYLSFLFLRGYSAIINDVADIKKQLTRGNKK